MTTLGHSITGFRWPGGKSKLAAEIISYLPKQGRKWIDLFAGRANITIRALEQGYEYESWILNDIGTYKFLLAVRDCGSTFKVIRDKSDAEFQRLKRLAQQDDPYALICEAWFSFNGGTYDSGGANTEGGRRSPESYEQNVRRASELLRNAKVEVMSLDWQDCLREAGATVGDVAVVDSPYINAGVGSYTAETICPTELIEELKEAPYRWVMTEHEQPLYLAALGEPVARKRQQMRCTNFRRTEQGHRIECIWVGGGKSTKRDSHGSASEVMYPAMTISELLAEIKDVADRITYHRNQMNRQMRERLLPALMELKRRTYRRKPGFYESLAEIGINADTCRQWFYRSRTADEAIELLDIAKPELQSLGERIAPSYWIEKADAMAQALTGGKTAYAKKLATVYLKERAQHLGEEE